jgi:hypothetical protein
MAAFPVVPLLRFTADVVQVPLRDYHEMIEDFVLQGLNRPFHADFRRGEFDELFGPKGRLFPG